MIQLFSLLGKDLESACHRQQREFDCLETSEMAIVVKKNLVSRIYHIFLISLRSKLLYRKKTELIHGQAVGGIFTEKAVELFELIRTNKEQE